MTNQQIFEFFEQPPKPVLSERKSDLRTGQAGEYLASAIITSFGFEVLAAPQNSAYDLLADVRGQLIRIQVKTRTSDRSVIHFGFTRGCYASRTGTYRYEKDSFDLAACVSLKLMRVIFLGRVPLSTVSIRRSEFQKTKSDRTTWDSSLTKILESQNYGRS